MQIPHSFFHIVKEEVFEGINKDEVEGERNKPLGTWDTRDGSTRASLARNKSPQITLHSSSTSDALPVSHSNLKETDYSRKKPYSMTSRLSLKRHQLSIKHPRLGSMPDTHD
ncbi:hypothetical protein RJT34_24455 [Clitoria ternatea]|uniref:Uncharacterized protein n=1 Tax=Clitoria ternatea TaxID=43366 RepID=A0AAN9FUQ7_CLITE